MGKQMNKKLSVLMLALAGIFVFETANVSAAQTGFTITANSSYKARSSGNLKVDYNSQAYVNWKSSNKGSHKEWFRVVNSNNVSRSESKLFSYLSAGIIKENSTEYGFTYYLQARREHIIDPSTTVKGNWES